MDTPGGTTRVYQHGQAFMPEPWDRHLVTFAIDQQTGEKLVGVGFICEIVGLDVDTQTRILRKACEAALASEGDEPQFALDPDALRKINMPPREDAKARAGYREQVCILHTEVGWWLSHIPPHKIKDVEIRTHIVQFQRAVKAAADRLFWQRGAVRALLPPAERKLLTTTSCQHDLLCPWCGKWHRASTRDGHTEVERII
jgi:hypothetical protein